MKTYMLAALLAAAPLAAQADTTVRSVCQPKQGWELCYTITETAVASAYAYCLTRGTVQICRAGDVDKALYDKAKPGHSFADDFEQVARDMVVPR